jgi:hypothetical protein
MAMRWITDNQATYGRRLICSGADIEDFMEERYYRFCGGKIDVNRPAIDVGNFIDRLFKERVEYSPDDSDLPSGVLGATVFNQDKSCLIRISAGLYKERNAVQVRGRFRFTCAHESFHALVHGPLFQGAGRLFCHNHTIKEDVGNDQPKVGDYTEWQANRGAAALLMPRSIFEQCVKQIRSKSNDHEFLVNTLVRLFDVSKQAATIRLQNLGLLSLAEDDFELQLNGIDSYRDLRER